MQSAGTNINVTSDKIEKFIGILFRMGLVQMHLVRSYWETYMNFDNISTIMSRNRSFNILRNIHFVDKLR